VITLVIYACLYSAGREVFVEKIMKMDPLVQEDIVGAIEKLELELR
jgi:hypothetical protein